MFAVPQVVAQTRVTVGVKKHTYVLILTVKVSDTTMVNYKTYVYACDEEGYIDKGAEYTSLVEATARTGALTAHEELVKQYMS